MLLLSDLAGRPTSCDLEGFSVCRAEGSTLVQRIRHARRDKAASLAKNRASCRCSSFQKYISLLRNESHNYETFEQPVIQAFSYVIHSQSIRIDALFEDLKDTRRDAGLFSTYPQFLMRISALLLHPHRNTPYYGCFVRLPTEFHAHICPPTRPNRRAEERLSIWIL